MSNLQMDELEVLKDLFPGVSEGRLREHLLQMSLEHAINALLALPLDTLQDMFPDRLRGELELLLSRNSLEQCIQLLTEPASDRVSRVTGVSRQAAAKWGKSPARGVVLIIAGKRDVWRDYTLLDETIDANPALEQLNYAFLQRAFCYFDGDTSKVAEAAAVVLEEPAASVDALLGLPLTKREKKRSLAETLRAEPLWVSRPKPKPKVAASVEKQRTVEYVGKLDLHGLTVSEAVSKAQGAVSRWWDSELAQREQDGRLERFSKTAVFVEPLEIITGRGIHSVGPAKIHPSVVRMLGKAGYAFEELTGRVLVTGRKR